MYTQNAATCIIHNKLSDNNTMNSALRLKSVHCSDDSGTPVLASLHQASPCRRPLLQRDQHQTCSNAMENNKIITVAFHDINVTHQLTCSK